MSETTDPVTALLNQFGFTAVDSHTALGEPGGVPTTLTLLGSDPPAVMFGFRVNPEGTGTGTVSDLIQGLPQDAAALSFEDGYAWLSLYNLEALPPAEAPRLVAEIAAAISSTDLALPRGCFQCGAADAQLLYADGRPARLCAPCVDAAAEERRVRDTELNRPTVSATLALPGSGLYVAAGWAAIWVMLDFVLERWQIKEIEINEISMLLGLGFIATAGFCLGWPMGTTLRQSFAIRKWPRLMSVVAAAGAAVVGEILYVTASVFLLAGVFDVGVAVRLLPQVVATYTGFWVTCKLLLAAAIGVCCWGSASRRKTASLDV